MSQTKPQRPALSRAREMRVETDGMRADHGADSFFTDGKLTSYVNRYYSIFSF